MIQCKEYLQLQLCVVNQSNRQFMRGTQIGSGV